MPDHPLADESLIQRLPLPLAQLYRRAHNAKTPLERHNTAFYCWEAGLKLLGAVAVVEYAEQPQHDEQLSERLKNLARPALGHWWEFVRSLVPFLADKAEGTAFGQIRDLLGKSRDDLPRAAGLDATLREHLEGKKQSRPTVKLAELFDRLVTYRNKEFGHGASGRRSGEHYQLMAVALLAGVGEILGRLPWLAGGRLLYVDDVARRDSGDWQVDRLELVGEFARRVEAVTVQQISIRSPKPELLPGRVYLEPAPGTSTLRCLHPLVIQDDQELLFLNARLGRQRTEYLGYNSGRVITRPDTSGEQRVLLGRILGLAVDDKQVEQWSARSQAEDPPAAAEPACPPNRQLGEFEVVSELGRGGMGIVYRAWQPFLGRCVALKKLQRSGDTLSEARFAREIKALGRVEHPHLVKIFTSGVDGDNWFYAMELVEGATLAAVCERLQSRPGTASNVDVKTWHDTLSTVCEDARHAEKPLSGTERGAWSPPLAPVSAAQKDRGASGVGTPHDPRSKIHDSPAAFSGRGYVDHVVGLMAQVADAAHALHQAGIVHRDVKPGNILVTADGQNAVLMDLGLAQLADELDGRLTRTRQFVGTLRYASPQQVMAVGQLDRRSDVYSLGATLWELLSLRPLFGATEQTPIPQLMEQIQRDEPDRLGKYHPGLPRDVEAIVHKCLEKSPDRRYATARELALDLRRFLDSQPVQARPVTRLERAYKWARRHPAPAAVMALIILLAATLPVIAYYRSQLSTVEGARQEQSETIKKQATAQKVLEREAYCQKMALAWKNWQAGHGADARDLLDACEAKYRNFEWYALQHLVQPEAILDAYTGHTLFDVTYSPDGGRIASADLDGKIRLWDAKTYQLVDTLDGHKDRVFAITFSPDGQHLASGGLDKTVIVWDVSSAKGQQQLRLDLPDKRVLCLAFSKDGKRLYSASDSGKVYCWDAATGSKLAAPELETGRHDLTSFAFSPNGLLLAAGNKDGEIAMWRADNGQRVYPWRSVHYDKILIDEVAFSPDSCQLTAASAGKDGKLSVWTIDPTDLSHHEKGWMGSTDAPPFKGPVSRAAFSPDGRWLAASGEGGMIQLFNLHTRTLATVGGHKGEVTRLCYKPDSQQLASACADGTIMLWDAQPGKEVATLAGHTAEVNHVVFSPDGKRLASASGDKTIKIWDVLTGLEERTLIGHTEGVFRLAYNPKNDRQLASGSWDHTVILWDPLTAFMLPALAKHTREITQVAFSPDGHKLASASRDNTVILWDVVNPQWYKILTGHTNVVQDVVYSPPDGRQLASAGWDKSIKLWDADGNLMATLVGHTDKIRRIAYSPDGKLLASASFDRTAKLWDAQNATALATFIGHTNVVLDVAFSPDGKRVASADSDGAVKLWDVSSHKLLHTLPHKSSVMCLTYTPDGERLAAACKDGTVRLWDVVTGLEVGLLAGHTDWVVWTAFSSNGRQLISASKDKTMKLWYGELDPDAWRIRRQAMQDRR